MPRPKSLPSTDIAGAALAVVDHGGLAALSIRAVAAELGMGTMSLYRYFDDRQQLEALVDHVVSSVHTDVPRELSWQQRVTELRAVPGDGVGADDEFREGLSIIVSGLDTAANR
jgi:AcrR family transcriptional regulator